MPFRPCLAAFAITLLLVVAPPASGQQAANIEARFKELDRDKDGKVTRDELPQRVIFNRFDTTGDGIITLDEALGAIGAKPAKTEGTKTDPKPSTDKATASTPPMTPVRQGPRLLQAAAHGVGRLIPEVAFTDLAGESWKLTRERGTPTADEEGGASHPSAPGVPQRAKLTVLVMTSTSCPLSKKYLPTLVELAKTWQPRGVRFVVVNPVATDVNDEMRAAAARLGDAAIYVHDKDGSLARAVGATTTTDAIVIDAARTVVYHGAIDDQYGFGYSLDAPRRRYLEDALTALAENRPPTVEATAAPGCALEMAASAEAAVTPAKITWHNQISRFIQRHCVECHRPGGVGPFSLQTYDEVVAHSPMIAQVIENKSMPPWFAVEPATEKADEKSGGNSAKKEPATHSPWSNDRTLADTEKAELLAWIAGDKALGDEADAPQSRVFVDGWLIGKPDAVFEFAEPQPVKATGTMPYQMVSIETKLDEDKWVQAMEVQPGDRAVVHHVLVFAVAPGDRTKHEGAEDGFWAIYVPGNSSQIYPAGFAKRLPKGATLRFQMHYTPNGTATEDRTRIGLIFAKQPPKHEVRVAGIVNTRLRIPPGADNHQEVATLRVPLNSQVLGFMPHMHLRGKACRYEVLRDGQAETLLDIPRYDFNWQLLYKYADPLPLTAGETLRFTAWFDNSDKNPANPDPTKTVRWGPQTFDEMHLGYVEYYFPGEDLMK